MDLVLYVEAHQPPVLRGEPPARPESPWSLIDVEATRSLFERALEQCYLPLLETLEELAPAGLKVGLRATGLLLEFAERWGGSLLELLSSLISKGVVEPVAGPYFNALPALLPAEELVEQVRLHQAKLRELFGLEAKVFAEPYLAYSDDVGQLVREKLGLRAALAEGAAQVLAWRTPHFVYRHPSVDLSILVRDHRLSDEVAFGLGRWFTAAHFAERVSKVEGTTVLVAVPAETFGLFVPAGAGAFEFLRWLPKELSRHPWVRPALPSEAAAREPVDVLSVPQPVTWLETKDLRPLAESPTQRLLLALLAEAREAAAEAGALDAWRLLTQADYLLASRDPDAALRLARALCALRGLAAREAPATSTAVP